MQRGLVAVIAALAMFPTAAVAADLGPVPQQQVVSHHRVPDRHMTPPQLWAPAHATPRHSTRTGYVKGRVTTRHARLHVRSGRGIGYRVVGSVRPGATVHIRCKKNGSTVHGNRRWFQLSGHQGYVSAHYVRNLRTVRWC
ncbi:hypothetical protein AS200_14505 [Streptomyces sp. CdTB01]|nr:hypothetical protein AS200_14505 [Streptomyces sp. CdTB01]